MSMSSPEHDRDPNADREQPLVHVGGGTFERVDPREAERLRRRQEAHGHAEQKRRPQRHTLQGLVRRPASEAELREAVEQAFAYRGDVSLLLDDGSVLTGFVFDRRDRPDLADCVVRLIPTRWRADPHERLALAYARVKAIMFSGRDAASGLAWEVWREKRAGDADHTEEQPGQ